MTQTFRKAATIVDATAMTVIAPIVLHGLTAGPLTERYARWLRPGPPRDAARDRGRPDATSDESRAES